MRIQLIKAPTENTGMPEHQWYTPLNLIWLANYLRIFGYDVHILDGQAVPLDTILARINADVVGVSFDVLSTSQFDCIVKAAKERGCTTVAGGHLATALGTTLLTRNPNLDAVALYDGEEALLGVVRAIEAGSRLTRDIPNCLFREDGQVVATANQEIDLQSLPLPKRDIEGIDMEWYMGRFRDSKGCLGLSWPYDRPTNSYSHKGCAFRVNGNGCSFCSRVDQRLRMKKASQVYEEYRYLVADFGVDHISDFSDSWISTPFLRDLVGEYERRGSIPASLRVYGDPRLVTADNARLLRQLGVHTVLLGIESGDERVLHMNGKRMSPATILAAVHALASNNIQVADAYVLGLIGETRESVQKTIELARTLRNACDTEISYWNIMTPLPGSHVWRSLCARGLVDDSDYHLIPDHLERLSTRYLTHLGDGGYEHLIGVREEMLASSKVSSAEFVPRMAELAVPPISRHIGKSNGEQCVLPSSVNRRISHEDR